MSWNMEDMLETFSWAGCMEHDDREEMLSEINRVLGGEAYPGGWDQLIIEWKHTAEFWEYAPEAARDLVEVVGGESMCTGMTGAPERVSLARRHPLLVSSMLGAVLGFGWVYGVEHLIVWLTPHPSVEQTLAWGCICAALLFATGCVTGWIKAAKDVDKRWKGRNDDGES
jgi:hypothetical protein